MVVLTADDPGCHSSQNEQDNRHYARAAGLPCLEPASAQEAKDMARFAFQLARQLQQPVMLRTTTRVSHMRGLVTFGDLPTSQPTVPFVSDPGRYVPVPAVALRRHRALAQNLEKAEAAFEDTPFIHERFPDGASSRLGVIASGVARNYLADALFAGGWADKVCVMELGATWPLPEARLAAFLGRCDRVLVLEEGDPILERDVRSLAQKKGLAVAVEGKDDPLTTFGEYSTTLVQRRLSAFLSLPCTADAARPAMPDLPGRPPNLCPGCSHRAVYLAVRRVFGDDPVYSSDIGCYTLGLLPPLRTADFLVCMGSSITAGGGFAKAGGRPAVAFIGDSTFFHSGMTGLANAVFNRHNLIVVILDNGTTAMTGHQPNPGMDREMLGDSAIHLDIEAIVRGIGVTKLRKVKAYNLQAVTEALEAFKDDDGVRVLIASEPCVLYARRSLKKRRTATAVVAKQGTDADRCLKELACPAFRRNGEDLAIDETQCTGCMVCLQAAPTAFKTKSA
jgi:indolepyruvate ferredoxin oxidoreductase alpha subunit